MKSRIIACVLIGIVLVGNAQAESKVASASSEEGGTSIVQLINTVAAKSGKKFIVDPRVRAMVTAPGVSAANLSYGELLAILTINNFAAVDYDGLVRVVPMADVRVMPVPTLLDGKKYLDDEVVTKVVMLKSFPATQALQALRPMLPQFAHLAVITCTNTLVIVDRYANVKRLLGVIDALDQGKPYKPNDCSTEDAKKQAN